MVLRRDRCVVFSMLICLVLVLAAATFAEVPKKINYQGKITGDTGDPLPGSHDMTFRIYGTQSGGSPSWTESRVVTADNNGIVSIILGDLTPINASFDGSMWLEVEVDGQTLSPRREIVSVPYAFVAASSEHAENADSLGGIHASVYSQGGHTHDNRYYTESELNTGGTINQGSNPVDWTKLKSVPVGFADGTDDVGGAGDGHSLDAADGNPIDALYLDNEGDVRIGTTTEPARLSVRTSSGNAFYAASEEGPAVLGAANSGYGLYGSSVSGYAGYFLGDVHASGELEVNGEVTVSTSYLAHTLFCENQNIGGTAVWGVGNGQMGYAHSSGCGVAATGYRIGLYARANSSSSTGQQAGIHTEIGTGDVAAVCYRASDGTQFKILGTGIASTIMSTSGGRVSLVCPESPEAWVDDYGSGEIQAGFCHVELDPMLLDCVTVNEQHPLKVFVQMTSPLANQFYVDKGQSGFDVIVLGADAETANATFDYRVVGKWKDYESVRFAKIDNALLETGVRALEKAGAEVEGLEDRKTEDE